MTTLQELKQLAEAAMNEPVMEKERFVNWASAYVSAANPATIQQMIACMEKMGKALEYYQYDPMAEHAKLPDALTAFKEFGK